MTALILPPTGGGGVTIYPDPSSLPGSAPVGTIAGVASDVSVRQWDGAAWRVVNDASSPTSVSDTSSVDLTVTAGALTADVRLSAAAPGAGYVAAALDIQADGLRARFLESAVHALFSVTDTNSIDASYDATAGAFSAALKLSAVAAGAGFVGVSLDVQSDGLRARFAESAVRALLSVTDTASIDMSYNATTGALSAALLLSSASVGAGFQAVPLAVVPDGLLAGIADASIRSVLSAASPLSYNATTGVVGVANQSANLVLAGPTSGGAGAATFRSLVVADIPTGIDHNTLANLTSGDPHTQYAFLAGRAGGQTYVGGTAAGNDLTLQSTSNASRGSVRVVDALRRSNRTENASFVSGLAADANFATAANLQAATVTLETRSNAFAFLVTLSTGESLMFHASQATAEISCVSDPSGLFLLTDAGTGLFVSKSAASSVISIKNRMGGARDIGVLFLSGQIASATAWA